MVTISQFEDAIIDTLKAMLPSVSIDTYDGELDDEESIANSLSSLPSILLAYGGSKIERRGSTSLWRNATETLFICAAKLRDDEGEDIYSLLDQIIDALQDKDLGLNIVPCEVEAEQSIYTSADIKIYAVDVKTQLPR
jgi:phage gp37-like protein